MHNGYQTKSVTLAQGGTLSIVNLDSMEHTVTSDARDGNGNPLFNKFAAPGSTTSIPAVSQLAAGTYTFFCQFHPTVMQGTLTIEGGSGGVTPTPLKFEQPLFIPPILTGDHIRIRMKQANIRVLPHGPLTTMWTFGGTYPGPTISRLTGHDTKVTFVNGLPLRAHAVTIHFHGDHHLSKHDGQPSSYLISRGHARTYDYPLTDAGRPERAAFDWYHDHRMMETGRNVWMGLQGMFIIRDGMAAKLHLPTGRFDIPLTIANRSFTSDNQLTNPFPRHPTMAVTGAKAPPGDGTVGAQILANGRYAPFKRVSAHRYRLRLLNGSNFTSYNFRLSDGRPLVQIGTGNGLLPRPVVRQSILLGPAQRADVVVDFHGELNQRVVLETVPRTDNTHGGADTPTAQIMQFRVTSTAADSTRIPATLQRAPHIDVPTRIAKTWTFNVAGDSTSGAYWTVNGRPFDPNHVSFRVRRGTTQLWRLRNASTVTHYIHLHEEQWHTVLRDGKRPPPWERGLEDTWKLDPGETVRVAARFTDYQGLFMLHCHMLDHEDHGLMAQFRVIPPRTTSTTTSTTAAKVAQVPRPLPSLLTPLAYTRLPRLDVGDAVFSLRPQDLAARQALAQRLWMCAPRADEHGTAAA